VEINESRIPVAKDKGIPGDEKREQEKARFKTGANSASPNANSREKGSTPSEKSKRRQCCRKGTVKDTKPNEELHRTLGLGE